MLQNIRDYTHSWFAWILITLLCLSFSLWGIQSYIESSSTQEIAASVNGIVIPQKQLNLGYERLKQQKSLQLGENFVVNDSVEKQLKQQALRQLITDQVLTQAAVKQGFRFTQEQLGTAIRAIPTFQEEGQFSPTRFQEVLSRTGFSEQEFVRDLHAAMLINQARVGILASAFALSSEVGGALQLINQKRDIAYLQLSKNPLEKNNVISEKAIKEYYQAHQDQFKSPEKISIEYIDLSLDHLKTTVHSTTSEMKHYYEENINNFTTPGRFRIATLLVRIPHDATDAQISDAQTKVTSLVSRIRKGEDFGTLVEQYSDDPVSKQQKGDLGWVTPGTFDPVLENAALRLKQVGDISEPLRTKYGFVIVKLSALQQPQVQSFNKVQKEIDQVLSDQKAQQLFSDQSEKLSNATYADPSSLVSTSKALHLPIKSTDLFTKAGGSDALTRTPQVLAAAFNPIVITHKNNSDLIELDPTHVMVLRMKQHVPETIKPLNEVMPLIKAQLSEAAAKQQQARLADEILAKLRSGVSDSEIATRYHASWERRMWVRRNEPKVNPLILNQAFHMSPPQNNAGEYSALMLPSGEAVIMKLLKVHQPSPHDATSQQYSLYQNQLTHTYGRMDYDTYLASLFSNAKIKITEEPRA